MHKNKWLAALLVVAMLAIGGVPQALAVSTTTMQVALDLDKQEAIVNGTQTPLDAAPKLIGDLVYIPLKAVATLFDVKVEWNNAIKQVEMSLPRVKVQFDIDNKLVSINSVETAFDTIAAMDGDRLMVKLNWFADFIGAKQEINPINQQIKLVYVKQPDDLYNEGTDSNAPVAKFTFGKSSYRLGEPVKYVDLSYDPDAEGIAKYEWKGKKEAFFTPGKYPISLKVTDSKGHVSKEYTRYITIDNISYLDEFSYNMYNKEVGTRISLKKDGKVDWSLVWAKFQNLPIIPTKVTEDRSRTLIVSDSPETFTEKGILYRERINGKARLYADHVNGTTENIQFVIMAKNTTNKTVTVKTTNKGEVYPSIYANLIGHEASVDFMLNDPVDKGPLVIPPGQSYVYSMMPDFYPGQGVNLFYDVESDGEVEYSFVAMSKVATPSEASLALLKELDFNGHVRGTFPVASKTWNLDLSSFKTTSRITIGDGEVDPFDKGYDRQRKQVVLNEGNYGMMYKIHAEKPRKMVVLLFSKGGPFKGPFKINGEFVMAPPSGVIQAFEEVQVLARTTGDEASLDIEFTPPAGSAFPIDIVFYPLEELK
ncbi:stalk domain-containing protein [Paenibacillus contaminans]|uniref:Copper amine oxidase N-terminal domain-containing protein n=1 Tax=Paenibacillus contaminans TaxID=450362 RepID=A0A329LM60_9BACL|nr:stalk domain-containing protein [Paenibacillus contaminans]RAV09061.1 copper amine oxidase N-terminal domain-containing protein [Paenibacillus contaminans]